MRILVLAKRQPMGRDLLERPYGRFFHLPRGLAERGHAVKMLLVHHQRAEESAGSRHGLEWETLEPRDRPLALPGRLLQSARAFRPDWILGCSDTYYGILAVCLARRLGARALLDAYDNYASYVPWCRPLHSAWFAAARAADLVSVAGPTLATLFALHGRRGRTLLLPMAVDPVGFYPRDRFRCRAQLSLPHDREYIGYFGSIARSRGIEVLFEAWRRLRSRRPELELLLAGRLESGLELPDGARFLGYVADELLPIVMNAVDVLAVVNQDSAFGNYSYPIKLYEAMACGLRVVASATESVSWVLSERPASLAPPGDPAALARALERALMASSPSPAVQPGWEALAGKLAASLAAN
jgi:glycosyltransferase involved in cell wall biosynthesis